MPQTVTEELDGNTYTVVSEAYADTVSVMVYKNHKLGKVFRCQLHPHPGGIIGNELILPGITPQPLLGSSQEDAAGQLYASVIASMVSRQSPDDSRQLIVGLGKVGPGKDISSKDREELLFVTKLVESSRVW